MMRAYRVSTMFSGLVAPLMLFCLLLSGCAGKDEAQAPAAEADAGYSADQGPSTPQAQQTAYRAPSVSSQEQWEAPSGKATFLVAPFEVQGPQNYLYLQRSIPQMITSRITVPGSIVAAKEPPANAKPVSSEAEAEKLRTTYKADYVIWGTVNVVGDTTSMDVRVRNKAGKVMPLAREANTQRLMDAVGGVSDAINRQVFGRTATSTAARSAKATGRSGSAARGGGVMNPELMDAESRSRDAYLNPQFRYSGASQEDDSRLRSQALNFAAIGMEVVDATGNGRSEIFLMTDRQLYAYNMDSNNQLKELGRYDFPMNHQCLSIRSMRRPDGRAWLIVNGVDKESKPKAAILTFNGNSFSEVLKNIDWYLNVVKLPPSYQPTLIGQEAQPPRLFKPGSLSEVMKQGNQIVPTKRLNLPKDANVFNFTYLPGSHGALGGDKLVVLGENENLRTYGPNGNRLAQSSEKFSGSAVGLQIDPSMPGLGKDTITMASMFYIPMRMEAIDLEQDGNWELVVNKPISTASQIFDRYRAFPQSELHSLFWDGTGLNLQWKTRRIKGAMVDYTLADANNDGVPDLVCCVNTHPGALGVKARKTMVLLYPLDLSKTDPNTPTDKSEMYN